MNVDYFNQIADNFVKNIVTEDETPISDKKTSKVGKFPNEQPTKN